MSATTPASFDSNWSDGRILWGPMPGDAPEAADPTTSRRLSRQGRRDTAPEVDLRRRLHRLGLRYRVDRCVVPGSRRRVDIVFAGPRVAVFVDGCFWHRCPDHCSLPKNNREWWDAKLARNVERDRDTDAQLRADGWAVLRFWEHADMQLAAAEVRRVIRDPLAG